MMPPRYFARLVSCGLAVGLDVVVAATPAVTPVATADLIKFLLSIANLPRAKVKSSTK